MVWVPEEHQKAPVDTMECMDTATVMGLSAVTHKQMLVK